MKITDIRLRAVNSENEVKLKAYADVTFNGCFVVHGLKIIDGQKGMFVAMPSRKMPDGEYKDIAHPITPELRKEITETVIARYNEVMATEGAIPADTEEVAE